MSKLFHPLSTEAEHDMLSRDGGQFSTTTAYIENLILAAFDRFTADEGEKTSALRNLKQQIPTAAGRYLSNNENKEFKFSTYFTWYIQQEIAKYDWKKIDSE